MSSTATSIREAELQARRIRMAAAPAAAGEARDQVRAAIRAWQVPVDPDTAVLLTSELVTNAIMAAPGKSLTLSIRSSRGRLRIDVHDTSRSAPELTRAGPEAEAGRGLMLVNALAGEWGYYRTPGGKAVWFTLNPG